MTGGKRLIVLVDLLVARVVLVLMQVLVAVIGGRLVGDGASNTIGR